MEKAKKHIYFEGLNGLRFFAALAVILTHIELVKGRCGIPNIWHTKVFMELGSLGVYFFFVLSGFLITYLLFAEKEYTGMVQIKNFYLRRIFRIWPLYYIIMFLGFFVYPNIDFFYIEGSNYSENFENNFWGNFIGYVLILPNMAYAFFSSVPHIGQSWSIGVEEQFYIVWPWLIKKSKNYLRLIILFFFVVVLFKALVLLVREVSGIDTDFFAAFIKLMAMSKFECMAIGGFGAYLLYFKKEYLEKYVFNIRMQLLSYLGVIFLLIIDYSLVQNGIHIVYSLFFLSIILNVSSNPDTLLRLNNAVLNLCGKISYGIYMYHFAVVYCVVRILSSQFSELGQGVIFNILVYSISIGLSIGVSYLSYEYIEKRFILMKSKFTSVKSGSV